MKTFGGVEIWLHAHTIIPLPCQSIKYSRRMEKWSSHFRYMIAQSIQWRATGWTAWVRFPTGSKDFSLLHRVQTGSGAHPASYVMGTGGSFPDDKEAVAWSWPLACHLVPRSRMVELLHLILFQFWWFFKNSVRENACPPPSRPMLSYEGHVFITHRHNIRPLVSDRRARKLALERNKQCH
jgi:hypothetical protein